MSIRRSSSGRLTYPFHDQTIAVTRCGRICFKGAFLNSESTEVMDLHQIDRDYAALRVMGVDAISEGHQRILATESVAILISTHA